MLPNREARVRSQSGHGLRPGDPEGERDEAKRYCISEYQMLVGNAHLALVSRGEELEGGETVDLDRLDLIGCGVHLSHDDVSVVHKLLSQLLPDGSQLLAVSTPRCVWKSH